MNELPTIQPWRFPSLHVPDKRLVDTVFAEVAAAFGYTPKELRGRDRHPRIAWARQVAMCLLVDIAPLTRYHAAQMLGRDKATFTRSCRRVEALTSTEPALGKELSEIRQRIVSRLRAMKSKPFTFEACRVRQPAKGNHG